MEFLEVNGKFTLAEAIEVRSLNPIIAAINRVVFVDKSGFITTSLANRSIHIAGEGLIGEEEGRRVVILMEKLLEFSADNVQLNVHRVRWELHIRVGGSKTSLQAA